VRWASSRSIRAGTTTRPTIPMETSLLPIGYHQVAQTGPHGRAAKGWDMKKKEVAEVLAELQEMLLSYGAVARAQDERISELESIIDRQEMAVIALAGHVDRLRATASLQGPPWIVGGMDSGYIAPSNVCKNAEAVG